MLATDNVENVNQPCQRARRILTIAGGRADRVHDLWLGIGFGSYGFSNFEKCLQLQSRLRNHQRLMQRWEIRDVFSIPDDESVVGRIANDADHFRMIGIAGDDYVAAILRGAFGQALNASYERAGRIDNLRGELLQFG